MPSRDNQETELLAYRLLPGEERHRLALGAALIHWSYLAAKKPSAKGTVILLHGVASNGSRWEEFLDTTDLRDDWNFIRMDLRGHAASICRKKARLEDWCADVTEVMKAVGVQKAVIIGHSLGAQVTLNLAAFNEAQTPDAAACRVRDARHEFARVFQTPCRAGSASHGQQGP